MDSSFKLGRIAGIEVGIHYTWLFAFALVTWSLAAGFFPESYPGWSAPTYWALGLVSALALFASVLVHELSHSFVAQARGQGASSITLFIFGGVSNLSSEPKAPGDEFLVAVVGPLTSFVLAGVCWVANLALAAGYSPLTAALSNLVLINALLGVFNLLPGFPLDGGRILRSILWAVTGSLRRATQAASYIGQGVALLMVLWGVWQLLQGELLGGLWIAFIGWFLNNAAKTSRGQQVLADSLTGIAVWELMTPDPPLASPTMSVQEFVDRMLRERQHALPVGIDGRLVGIVSITDVKKLPQSEWTTTPVARVMAPAPLNTIAPEADLNDALRHLTDGALDRLPVVQGGRFIGLLRRADVLRLLELRDELGLVGIPGARPARAQPQSTS